MGPAEKNVRDTAKATRALARWVLALAAGSLLLVRPMLGGPDAYQIKKELHALEVFDGSRSVADNFAGADLVNLILGHRNSIKSLFVAPPDSIVLDTGIVSYRQIMDGLPDSIQDVSREEFEANYIFVGPSPGPHDTLRMWREWLASDDSIVFYYVPWATIQKDIEKAGREAGIETGFLSRKWAKVDGEWSYRITIDTQRFDPDSGYAFERLYAPQTAAVTGEQYFQLVMLSQDDFLVEGFVYRMRLIYRHWSEIEGMTPVEAYVHLMPSETGIEFAGLAIGEDVLAHVVPAAACLLYLSILLLVASLIRVEPARLRSVLADYPWPELRFPVIAHLFAVALALVPFGVYLQMQLLSARQNLTDAARMAGTTDVMLIMSPSFFVWSLAWIGLAVYSGYWLLRLRSAALGSQEIIADIDADFEAETRAE
ncbi:MAG: hypothetical protein IIC73_07480 [Armatimonadetes bacterium]|nr:hypothetical protein [Armatimonadota bacterium]